MHTTIEEAQMALQEMSMDVAADMGEAAVEAAWRDIVHACADHCPKEVADELLRREGFMMTDEQDAFYRDLVRLPSEKTA